MPPQQKPSHLGPLRIPLGLAASQNTSLHNNNIGNYAQVAFDKRLSRSSSSLPLVVLAPVLEVPASIQALEIPEIILLIQEQLDRTSLLISLRVATIWHRIGRHLVWQKIEWDNTASTAVVEERMVENAYRIRALRCMFHSQGGTSFVGSSVLLRGLLAGGSVGERTRQLRTLSLRGHFSLQSIASRVGGDAVSNNSAEPTVAPAHPPPPPRFIPFCIPTLAYLEIRPSVNSAVDIHLILNTAVGLRTLVIDSHGSFVDSNSNNLANVLLNPADAASPSLPSLSAQASAIIPIPEKQHGYLAHEALVSLKIQHLKMSRQELESVAARCPNLVEFRSVCSPATLWRQPLGSQQLQQQQQQDMESLESLPQQQQQPRSLFGALAKSCPRMQRFHVGLQQGGFHTNLVRDALTSFPRLVSFGLPTMDCTAATMDVIKSCQLRYHSARSASSLASEASMSGTLSAGAVGRMRTTIGAGAFLTSLTIMNVSSSEKVSQALHEFLCWTPYLKEFYAYNTTLYLEHMQSSRTGGGFVEERESGVVVVAESTVAALFGQQEQYLSRRDTGSSSSNGGGAGTEHSEAVYVRVSDQGYLDSESEEGESESTARVSHTAVTVSSAVEAHFAPVTPTTSSPLTSAPATVTVTTACGQQTRRQQWACTGLETLVVRFAHLPWRNSAEPPKRSKETFAFLAGLQNLKRLCIKEGLMLEAGREYDMLARLRGLEEVVFVTCYPIPIKPADMEWVVAPSSASASCSTSSPSLLKKVVVRRQKANDVLDKEMTRWFDEQGCGVRLSLQLTDCCEEEYRFL